MLLVAEGLQNKEMADRLEVDRMQVGSGFGANRQGDFQSQPMRVLSTGANGYASIEGQ